MSNDRAILKAIKKGKLEQLKQCLEGDPLALQRSISSEWHNFYDVGLLHVAARFGQAEIIKFLVAEGLDINKYESGTPLHYAARSNALEAIQALLTLGADPSVTTWDQMPPYVFCKNKEAKQLLLDRYKERVLQKEAEKQKAEAEEQAEKEIAPVAKAPWKFGSSDNEVVFEREVSGLRLTETFNFTAKTRILIAESLQTGNLAQPETKPFSEIPEMAELARAELAKLRGPKLVLGK